MSPSEKPENRPPESTSQRAPDRAGKTAKLPKMPELPKRVRIVLLVLGWVVVVIGVACLVLPGPGILIIVVGAALLSLVSVLILKTMHYVLRPWPRGWRAVLRMRRKAYQRILRFLDNHGWA